MTAPGLILVCDDDARRVERWAARVSAVDAVEAGFEVMALAPHTLARAFRGLRSRKAAARTREPSLAADIDQDSVSLIDRADVLIIDYDLTPDAGRSPDPVEDRDALKELMGKSGEEFAYLARCFASAGAIVVVNQKVQRRVFDLTLQQFADSFANVNITSHYLDSKALWMGSNGGFRPWSWPRLLDLPDLVRRRWELIEDLDHPILRSLGLSDDRHLYAFTQAQLDPLGDDPPAATFRDFAQGSEYGLTAKDRSADVDEDSLRRVAAAAVARWLEWQVVPGQNVLIDAPHLVQRFPGLLSGEPGDIDAWNRTADLTVGDAAGLQSEKLSAALVPATRWTSRPVWSLPKILGGDAAVLHARPVGAPKFVFCEDTSRFVGLDEAVEVAVAVPSPYFQRFVEMVDDVDYTPRRRIHP